MHTFLNLKDAVSNVLGRTDGTTANTIRDNAINFVRQNEIANAYPFSWLEKPVDVTVSAGSGDLPSDFNINHKLKDVRVVNSGNSNDDVFEEIDITESDKYGNGDHKYWITWHSVSNRWEINVPYDCTLRIIYYQIPATLSSDATYDIVPDLDTVTFLSAARYWLSSERDEQNHDRFKMLGQKALDDLIIRDKRRSIRSSRSSMWSSNMGFNVGD